MANASLNGDQSKQQQQQQQQQQQNYYNPNAAQSFVPQGGYQQFQQFQPQQQQQQYGGYNQYNQYQGGYNNRGGYQQNYNNRGGYQGYNQNQQYGGYQQYNSQPQQQQQQQSQAVKKTLKLAGSSGIKLANATKKVDTTSKPQSKESSPAPAPAPAAFASQEEKKEEKEAAAATPETKKETSAPAETKKEATPTPAAKKESTPTPAAATKKECSCKEQEDEIDEEVVKDMFGGKDHVSIIFMGHVDAGKSTMGGNILYLTGSVDKRTVEKYEREAKDAGRQGWYLSWVMDTNKEERNDGKTIEVGKAYFETDKRRYTILDAPGHKMYVSEMIGGASQADVGILVISARKGEYETGFEKGGQTREHALLAKTQGVNKIIVVVNKMDDSTVGWSKERYQECTTKLGAFLKGIGYAKDDIIYMPVSGYTGAGLKDRVDPKDCPWYDGPSLLEYLDNMDTMNRKINGPFMMPVSGKMKDLGTIVEGKIESGHVKKGTNLIMMPNKTPIEVLTIFNETEQECDTAFSGEQVRLKIKGIEEEDLQPGYVLTSPKNPVKTVTRFEAQIAIVELKSILSNGFSCVMHLHTAIEEVKFIELKHKLEKGTNRKSKKPPAFAKKGMKIIAILEVGELVCAETYKDYPQLGSLL
ncbi:Elongation factor Tu GTP binding domain family protein [Candida albicans]|uniref:Eukaryotic peptide chain release factor GTP-binding subunit n=1 Tax=Candida albicans TaxID=5476 RepID=A0A8H6F338_CANAX|nr:Elongation factor Tu GTP binding domain family protein [Candida albicans]